jgi:hypothetical protein
MTIQNKHDVMTAQKWGSIASFLQAAIFLIAPVIYLVIVPAATGLAGPDFADPFKLRFVLANPAFDWGDFVFGPLWAASLVVILMALQEHLGDAAPRRMRLAMIASCLSAALFVGASTVQTVGRHYISSHPELDAAVYEGTFRALSMVVPGLTSGGRHFLGWTLLLLGSIGWTTRRLPRILCIVYFVGALPALFAYLNPGLGELVLLPGVAWNIWQGILLWRREPTPDSKVSI